MNSTELQPEGLSILEACRVAGIGRTNIYEAIADGRLTARKFGKRTIILRTICNAFWRRCRWPYDSRALPCGVD
jgi:excisionase family DNA binding protein